MQGSWYQDATPNYTKIVRNTNMSSFPNTYIFPHPHGSSNNFTNSRHQEINLSLTCTLLMMSKAWMPISRMQPLWFSKTTCTCRYDEYFINLYVVKKGSRCCRKSKVTDTLHYLSILVFVLLWLFLLSMHSY